MRSAQLAFFGFGLAVCALNFFLSFVRPLWFQIVERRSEHWFVSALPLVGSLATVVALVLFHLPRWLWIVGIVMAALDTGGIHWFVGTMAWKAGNSARGTGRRCQAQVAIC